MKSILLATADRNMLPPLTEQIPAPMLPLADRPAIVYAIECMVRQGIKEIVIALHHQSSVIDGFLGSGERWNAQFSFLLQRDFLGSAGSLKRAEPQLTETFLVLPADALIDLDIDAALAFHRANKSMATVIVSPLPTSTGVDHAQAGAATQADCGMVALDALNRVFALAPKGDAAGDQPFYCSTGAYIFEPEVLSYIPANTATDCYADLLPVLLDEGLPVFGFRMDGYWNPLDSFPAYQAAQAALLKPDDTPQGNNPTLPLALRNRYIEAHEIQPGIWIGPRSKVHPTAQLTPPVLIGAGCRIGRDVEIGPNVVIGAGTVLASGATVRNSTILAGTYVGQMVLVDNRIVHRALLIDAGTGECVEVPDQFLLAHANPAAAGELLYNSAERMAAFIVLLLSLPLLLPLLLLLLLFSHGPVIIKATRFGKRPLSAGATVPQTHMIKLFHLRTRTVDDVYTLWGRWLERSELNRLPELINVVRGDIGLIGVKPLTPIEAGRIHEEWQKKRYECQAGLIGLWFTEAAVDASLDELCAIDTYQAALHTVRDDIRVLRRTPMAWLRRVRSDAHRDLADSGPTSQNLTQNEQAILNKGLPH